ncbi:hypothetical protein RUM44_010746 [Polyplax serrata]|uniref:ubiquitinyl hydrolase 1 n=1 Tax=Polyplax serrata TaxID=468196 RepID=A0ABR1AN30_POLSC
MSPEPAMNDHVVIHSQSSFDRPDEEVAKETLANHVRCNNSFVHAVFQAQFRSSLTCLNCQRQSNTFDPFLCVSVPIPHNQKRSKYVIVLYMSQQPRQVKLGLSVNENSTVGELREQLSSDTGIPESCMLLTQIDDLGFQRTFSGQLPVSEIKETDPVYCIEMPQLKDATEEMEKYILLCWVNVLTMDDHCARFGSPYTMQLCRLTGYQDLQKLMLKEMNTILHDDILTTEQDVPLFRIKIVDGVSLEVENLANSRVIPACRGSGNYQFKEGGRMKFLNNYEFNRNYQRDLSTLDVERNQFSVLLIVFQSTPFASGASYLDPTVDHPLYMEEIDQALALLDEDSGPRHLKLVLEWDLEAKESTIADDSDLVEEHTSVKQLLSLSGHGDCGTLEECFDLYTKAEVLGAEDKWHCPFCNRKQEVIKKLGLWSLPDILVIHLKRFRQQVCKNRSATKLMMMVDFPLYGFDMNAHLVGPPRESNGPITFWGSWKKPKKTTTYDDNVYDLYAICNHHGQDLQGGHYTAYCRNPYDCQWYSFDDTKVEPVPESSLVTNSAYILFYQRRGLNNSSYSISSSASTSSSVSSTEHWVYRMPAFYYQGKKVKSQDDITEVKNKNNLARGNEEQCKVENENSSPRWSVTVSSNLEPENNQEPNDDINVSSKASDNQIEREEEHHTEILSTKPTKEVVDEIETPKETGSIQSLEKLNESQCDVASEESPLSALAESRV